MSYIYGGVTVEHTAEELAKEYMKNPGPTMIKKMAAREGTTRHGMGKLLEEHGGLLGKIGKPFGSGIFEAEPENAKREEEEKAAKPDSVQEVRDVAEAVQEADREARETAEAVAEDAVDDIPKEAPKDADELGEDTVLADDDRDNGIIWTAVINYAKGIEADIEKLEYEIALRMAELEECRKNLEATHRICERFGGTW